MKNGEASKDFRIKYYFERDSVDNCANITAPSVINKFVAFLDVAPLTVRSYTSGIKQFVFFLQTQGITKPTRENVLAFKKELISKGRKPATIALYISAVRRFFDWTETERIYPNITRGIKSPKQDKGHKRNYLAAHQLQSVMRKVDRSLLEGKRNFAVLALMATCGLRTVEVVRANIEDLRTLGGEPVLFVQGKGRADKKDFVKLTEPVIAAIREYLNERGTVKSDAPLFASCSRRNAGGRLTTRTISGVCKSSMRNVGLDSPLLTAHSLRHSAVTIALMNGQTLAEVQYFARHSNISTTQIYAHNVDRLKSGCEAAITKAIFFGL